MFRDNSQPVSDSFLPVREESLNSYLVLAVATTTGEFSCSKRPLSQHCSVALLRKTTVPLWTQASELAGGGPCAAWLHTVAPATNFLSEHLLIPFLSFHFISFPHFCLPVFLFRWRQSYEGQLITVFELSVLLKFLYLNNTHTSSLRG